MKVINVRRRVEKHRWLRSDGKPNFSTAIHIHDSELKYIGVKEVIKASPSTPILKAAELMYKNGIRALPITNPESKILGLITTMDLVNYFGGGDYYNIVINKYKKNIYQALQETLGTIMKRNPITINVKNKLTDLLELMILSGYGVIPLVNNENEVIGIITERDIVSYLSNRVNLGIKVEDIMTKNVITIEMNKTVKDALKLMVSAGIRRLPIVNEKSEVSGIITSKDIVNIFGSHKIFKVVTNGLIDSFLNKTIKEFGTTRIVTVNPEDDLSVAIKLMSKFNVSGLLVVTNNILVGIITERDIIYALVTG